MSSKPELREAVLIGDLDALKASFEYADLGSNEYYGASLLHLAARRGGLAIVQFLVEKGAELNRRGGTFQAPAVTYSAEDGAVDVTEFLVEAGAKLDISHALRNPLMRAAKEGQSDVVAYLLTTSIDPHATYRLPTGALQNAYTEAENSRNQEVIDLLAAHGCRRPVEGVDKPLWEPSPDRMINQTPEFKRHQQITAYMESKFGPADPNGMQELLPVVEGMSVSINIIPPNDKHRFMVLFTSGMSGRPMNVPEGQEEWQFAELVIHLPADWPHPADASRDPNCMWPLKWLRKMAYYPHLENTWLGRPAAIVSSADPPEPLGPNTSQTCLMMIPDFSNLKVPLQREDGKPVHFFTLVPLYTEERDYELQHGMRPFLERLVEQKVPMTVVLDRPRFV